jgi:Double zinc ribbon
LLPGFRWASLTARCAETLTMHCPRCQHENPPPAKFCLECGSRLAPTCAQCGTALPAGAKFCLECGQPVGASPGRSLSPQAYTPKHLAEKILTSKGALEGERKQVTVLFADLKGSMELLADRFTRRRRMGPALACRCMTRGERPGEE